jgi:hypothetical protein
MAEEEEQGPDPVKLLGVYTGGRNPHTGGFVNFGIFTSKI